MKLTALLLSALLGAAPAPTPDIKVDQAGYLPGMPKVAFVVSERATGEFAVRAASDGRVVFRGALGEPALDAASGDRVRAADFTKLDEPGAYYLDLAGAGRSWEFAIRPDVYSRAYYLATRSFYGQRCGTNVDLGPEFRGYSYKACHLTGANHASTGKTGARVSAKGWHDAGDYGRYVVNSGLSTATLLWTYELFGDRVRAVRLDIPESGDATPDVLDEIRWNLDWMLSMQDADGGVWHKQTSERFAGFVMPEKDASVSYVIGTGSEPFKSSCATADFAAVTAIAARVYEPFDATFAKRCRTASEQAWAWTEKHPDVLFRNPAGVETGGYGDASAKDERLWAAAELWRTTRSDVYRKYVVEHHAEFLATLRPDGPPAWPTVAPMALWAYAMAGDDETARTIRRKSVEAADAIVARTSATGYRMSLTTNDYVWGSNGVAANYGVQLLVANAMKPDARYVETAADNLHYLLGRNTFSLSWVTWVGANPFRHPHHRPSGADANREPWPGLLSGGPNRRKQDEAMRKLQELPPAKMYLDEEESYASNEIAINWNAPLVFVLAGVSRPAAAPSSRPTAPPAP